MQKKVWLFAGPTAVLSAAGALLRSLELRGSLDESTMLMDFQAPSAILLALTLLALAITALPAARLTPEQGRVSHERSFHGAGTAAVGALSLLLLLAGAVLGLRASRGLAEGYFSALMALMAALGGIGWFSLGLDALRRKKGRYLSALFPVLFCCVFLILYYKEYAAQPALLYTLYPFLTLCDALCALHLLSGYTLGHARPRLAVFLCFFGFYLCAVALPGVPDAAYRLFFIALGLELGTHGVCLLLPHPLPPEPEAAEPPEAPEAPASDAPAGETEA